MWFPPVRPVTRVPAANRPRLESMKEQSAVDEIANGDTFHTPNTAVYYSPEARLVVSPAGLLDPIQEQISNANVRLPGARISQVSFSTWQTQRAFRQAVFVQR